MVQTAALLLLLWLAANLLLCVVYRRALALLWREPVLRQPILIVESDDWGAGPLEQAAALRAIAGVLARHRDAAGRAPVVSLALVLAVPDGHAIRLRGRYQRVELDDPRFGPILTALRDGCSLGVFSLQLHGLEHYWPETLMASADPEVRAWLTQDGPPATERLPSHLQSRWVDASSLPSKPLSDGSTQRAAAFEVDLFTRTLGDAPRVVVPPTFVWTRDTETAWAVQGIECVVTPGWRYPLRDAKGLPAGDEGPIANGDRAGGITYLARTDYFEPARGRDALYALRALDLAVAEGRPCLLENHRDNFIGDPSTCQQSLDQLDQLYREALARHGRLRFLSSLELARILRARDPTWLASSWSERLPARWQRLEHSGRPWRLMRLTGLAALGRLFVRLSIGPDRDRPQGAAT